MRCSLTFPAAYVAHALTQCLAVQAHFFKEENVARVSRLLITQDARATFKLRQHRGGFSAA
jgi:hypothetical protein